VNSCRWSAGPSNSLWSFSVDQLLFVGWLVVWLVGWLVDWLVDCPVDWPADWFIMAFGEVVIVGRQVLQ
jgi:hypothetical protein